jgi:hypothetical protein
MSICVHVAYVRVCARSLFLHPHPFPNRPDFVFNKRHDLRVVAIARFGDQDFAVRDSEQLRGKRCVSLGA